MARLQAECEQTLQKYRSLKEQEQQSYLWEAERRAKEEYLRSLRTLEKQFTAEEEIALLQQPGQGDGVEGEAGERMQAMLDNLGWEEQQGRRELEAVRLEIENLRSQNQAVGSKLSDNQMKLYQLIQDKIKQKSP